MTDSWNKVEHRKDESSSRLTALEVKVDFIHEDVKEVKNDVKGLAKVAMDAISEVSKQTNKNAIAIEWLKFWQYKVTPAMGAMASFLGGLVGYHYKK